MYSHPALVEDRRASLREPALVRARVHALAAGTWPSDPWPITLTDADIAAIGAAYDPARYQAPVVIGHPETDDPAWGWVLAASAAPDGLWLDVELLPEMAALIEQGRYRAVSVSLWLPDAPGNPSPGVWSLKHLGYLGAVPPAVKGLAPTQLNAARRSAQGVVTITLAEQAIPDIDKETTMSDTDQSVQLAEREAAIAAREREIALRERALACAAYAQELDAHIAAGRILPAEKPDLIALMERLDGAAAVTLAQGAEQSPLDVLRAFLARLPARVDLSERVRPERSTAPRLPKIPQGYRLSEQGLALHTRAVEYMSAHPGTDYLAAVRAVEHTI